MFHLNVHFLRTKLYKHAEKNAEEKMNEAKKDTIAIRTKNVSNCGLRGP